MACEDITLTSYKFAQFWSDLINICIPQGTPQKKEFCKFAEDYQQCFMWGQAHGTKVDLCLYQVDFRSTFYMLSP